MSKTNEKTIYDRNTHGKLHDPKSAASYLKSEHNISRSVSRLADMRVSGIGPEFLKQGRYIFYPEACLDSWAKLLNGKPLTRHTPFGVRDATINAA